MTLGTFARAVAHYRDAADANVISWGRTTRYNRVVGGPARSPHLIDLAVDVSYDSTPTLDTARQLAHQYGLSLRRARAYDHLQPLDIGD